MMAVSEKETAYINSQKLKFEDASRYYLSEANNTLRIFSEQLILFATVLLVFSSPIFSGTLIETLNGTEKIIVMLFWLLLVLSIIFGIVQLLIDHDFFKEYSDRNQKVVLSIASGEVNTEEDLQKVVRTSMSGLKSSSKTWPNFAQGGLLVLSLILMLILLGSLLFK